MTTGIVYHERYLAHEQYATHPERRERLSYTMDQLTEEGLLDHPLIRILVPNPAPEEAVLAVHDREYLVYLQEMSRSGGYIDPDTNIPVGLYETALFAAGGGIRAADAVLDGEVDNAFAMVRPPGHHAHPMTGAGFCYLNNMAVMVRHLQRRGAGRVLILDWDAHHGNGTQAIFYDDPAAVFMSVHQMPFYPGSGHIEEIGIGAGEGFTVNMPVPAGASDAQYIYLFEEIIAPLAEEFTPEFIAISAGQDNHFTDPLTGLALTARGYADLMHRATDLSRRLCGGRLVALLEGGYSVEGALPYTNLGIIAAMAGMDLSNIRDPAPYLEILERCLNPHADAAVRSSAVALKRLLSPYWDCMG